MRFNLIGIVCLSLWAIQIQAQGITNFTIDDGLASNTVNCLTVAGESILFGTDKGLSHFDGTEWLTITVADSIGLIDDVITAIHVDEDDELWAGTDFGLSRLVDTSFVNYTDADGIGNNRIQAIDSYDDLIVIGHKNGFAIYDKEEDIWSTFGAGEGFPFGGVTDVILLDDDILILGFALGGVYIYDLLDGDSTVFDEDDGLLSNRVKGLAFDDVSENTLWVATDNGMNAITGEEIDDLVVISYPSVFDLPPPHTINQLTDVVVDTLGNIWGGVYIDYLVNVGGVSYFDGNSWLTIDGDDGLVGPIVNQLAVGPDNCIWVATTTGVSKICGFSSSIEPMADLDFNIYPNPSSGRMQVVFQSKMTTTQELKILNSHLQTIKVENLTRGTSRIELNLQDLNSGLYFIQIGNSCQKIFIN